MRATVCGLTAAVLLALAGCGDDPELPVSGPVTTPTPPPTDQLKFDMLQAQRDLETYRLSTGTYTEDETLLGPTFPLTVTVKDAGTRSFYMAAYDDQGIRYAMINEDGTVTRTCDPPEADACPDGVW